MADLGGIDPNDLEYAVCSLVELLEGKPLIHRGLSTRGRAAGYTVDIFDLGHGIIAECSVEGGYFEDGFTKLRHDIQHAKQTNSSAVRLYLFATENCANSSWPDVGRAVADEKFGTCDIKVYDARLIATEIFDRIIVANNQVHRLADLLPSLRQLCDHYVFERGVPECPADYVADAQRSRALATALDRWPIVNLHGLSGSGKSYAAMEYAATHRGEYDAVLWISGDDLLGVTDLRAVPVERLGAKLNLAFQLKDRPCLLVVDSFEDDFAQIEKLLAENLHPETKVLVTSQHCAKHECNCELPDLDIATVAELLRQNSLTPPTEKEITEIAGITGRHPLVLAIIRDTVREEEITWAEIISDVRANLGSYELPDHSTIIERVLGRHRSGIDEEMHLLRWLDCAFMDAQFATLFLGQAGKLKLMRRSILKQGNGGYVHIHDLVRTCIRRLNTPVPVAFDPDSRFWGYFRKTWEDSPFHFQRSLHLHRGKVETGFDPARPVPGLQSYLCVLLGARALRPEGVARLAAFPLEAHLADRAESAAVVEAMERQWRDASDEAGAQLLLKSHEARLTTALVRAPAGPVRLDLLHHRGKFRRWLKRYSDARSDFEAVLAERNDRWSAHLQLARILAGSRLTGADTHCQAIFTAFEREDNAVPVTVVLAAFAELGRNELKALRDHMLAQKLEVLQRAVSLSLVEGFAQPYQMLGRIGRHLYYHHPVVLLQLVAEVSFPLPDDIDPANPEMFDIGECLKIVGKAHNEDQSDPDGLRRWCQRAIGYYERVDNPNGFNLTMHAECLILLEDYDRAVATLARVSDKDREAHWWHRQAQALRGLHRLDEAEAAIGHALDLNPAEHFRAAFLLAKGEILADRHDARCLAVIAEARALATGPKFPAQLDKTLARFRAMFPEQNSPE